MTQHVSSHSEQSLSFFTIQGSNKLSGVIITAILISVKKNRGNYIRINYSRSSCKRPPRELKKVFATRDGRLQEWALVSDHVMKQ